MLVEYNLIVLRKQNPICLSMYNITHEKLCLQIYHVTVMPCFDKKLEAARDDFYNEAFSTREVDCVITSGKLLK